MKRAPNNPSDSVSRTEESSLLPPGVWFFILTAFGISWVTFIIRKLGDWPYGVDQTLRIIIKFGPSLAGLLAALRLSGAAGVRDILRRVVAVRVHFGWFLLALLLPVLAILLVLPIRILLGGDVWATRQLDWAAALSSWGSLLAIRFFAGGGLGEELGWRGFMLPHLQAREGALRASIIIGLFHGAWHLPAFGVGTVLLTFYTVSVAIIFTWMYNRTRGNLLLPALMHASGNATLPVVEALFPAIDNEFLFPVLLLGVWGGLAGLLVWKVGAGGLGPVSKRIEPPTHGFAKRDDEDE